jgi:hypothetical protein
VSSEQCHPTKISPIQTSRHCNISFVKLPARPFKITPIRKKKIMARPGTEGRFLLPHYMFFQNATAGLFHRHFLGNTTGLTRRQNPRIAPSNPDRLIPPRSEQIRQENLFLDLRKPSATSHKMPLDFHLSGTVGSPTFSVCQKKRVKSRKYNP